MKDKDEGIVQFKINQSIVKKIGVEHTLIEKYSLNDAVVVPQPINDTINESISNAAASYIGFFKVRCGCFFK